MSMALAALILSIVAIGLTVAGFIVLYRKIDNIEWDE